MTAPAEGRIRLGGLTSGFDTETIVQQLLAVDQAKIDRLKEEKDLNIARIDTWKDVAEQLKSVAEVAEKLRSDGTSGFTMFDDKSVSSSTATTATATSSSSAIEADYSLVVTTLARAHVAYGTQKAAAYTLPAGGNVIIGGATIALSAGDTLKDIADAINAAPYLAGAETVATVIDDRLTLQTKNTGAAATIHGTVAGAPPFVNGTDDPSNILEGELGIINGAGNLVNVAQTSADSSFSVNGIPITTDTNTVTDAITGVTINLLTDGGATTTLKVSTNTESIKNTITEFVELYNETRDFIDRVRNAKLDDNEQFGLFFSDSLMRSLFNDIRAFTTGGIEMGNADWDGTVTAAAAAANATTITMNAFTNATGTLSKGDQFVISGDTTIYTVQNDATIAANSANVDINPPLTSALAGGESINVAIRSLTDIGVGVRTDGISGTEGVLGILDEGKLDSMLSSNIGLVRSLFTRAGDAEGTSGFGRRIYDWVDDQTKVSLFSTTTRAIDDSKVDGLGDLNDSLDEQIARLEARMESKEEALIRQFAEMENAMSRAQSSGAALTSLSGGGGQS